MVQWRDYLYFDQHEIKIRGIEILLYKEEDDWFVSFLDFVSEPILPNKDIDYMKRRAIQSLEWYLRNEFLPLLKEVIGPDY